MGKRIAAKEVRPGMRLFNKDAPSREFQWTRVTEVTLTEKEITITTNDYDTVKHPEEGVFVETVPEPHV